MKRVDLIGTIEGFGCILVRHGGKHERKKKVSLQTPSKKCTVTL